MSSPRLLARSLLAAAAAFAVCLAELPGLTGAAFELDDFSIFHPMFGAGTTISSPADLAGRNCLRWQLGHQVPFGLRELGGHQLSAAISRQRWGVGTGLSLRGTGRHQEASTWLGAGLSPMPALALGTGIHVLQLRQGHSPSVRAITLSAGVQLKIGPTLRLSAWLHGPARDLAQPRMLLSLSRILGDQSALQGYLTRRGGRQGGPTASTSALRPPSIHACGSCSGPAPPRSSSPLARASRQESTFWSTASTPTPCWVHPTPLSLAAAVDPRSESSFAPMLPWVTAIVESKSESP